MTQQDIAPPPETADDSKGRLTFGWSLAFVLVLALLIFVGLMLRRTQQGPIQEGDVVGDFVLTTFEGEQIHLNDLRGKVVVLNFWASWCKPCEQEAADLEAAWRFYKDRGDVVFLGVNYVDTEPEAKGYLARFDITYPNGPDLGTRISQEFRIRGVPETYVIDAQGRLRGAQIGPFTSLQAIQSMVNKAMTQQ